MNRLTASLLAAALLAASCSTAPQTATTFTLPTTTTAPPPAVDQPRTYELLVMATHPNGAQLRVERIEVLPDSVVVSGGLTNGSPYELRVAPRGTELVSEAGQVAGLVDGLEATELAPAEELAFTLRFERLPEPTAVTLVFNRATGASTVDATTSIPAFELGPIALDGSLTRPPLPDPVPVSRSVVDASGIEMQLEGVNFTENRIGLWVRISNPLQVEARIAPSIAPSLVVDDLGNRYPLLLPEGEGWISIPAGSARSGTLSFAGRIHPDTTRLNIGLNAGSGSRQGEDRIYPELVIRDLPLTGAQAAALPQPVPLAQTLDHPAGVRLQLATLSFSDMGIEVPAVVSNQGERAVALAAEATYAYDDLGNRYPLVPLPDNPHLVVEAGTTIEGTWVFSGRVADGATSLALIVNQGGSADDPATSRPSFQLGPFPLTRSGEGTAEVAAKVFAVGLRSRLVADELAASQVDQITQTLTQFDATEVEDGFQLTLPDSILFDFGSAELRGDALSALTLIAEVLRYFADAPVTVVGHTDSVGSASANQQLSELRAQSVVDALIRDHGIDPGRLTAVGRGADEPVAPNTNPDGSDNPEGRQLNRRVEIVVHTDQPLPLP